MVPSYPYTHPSNIYVTPDLVVFVHRVCGSHLTTPGCSAQWGKSRFCKNKWLVSHRFLDCNQTCHICRVTHLTYFDEKKFQIRSDELVTTWLYTVLTPLFRYFWPMLDNSSTANSALRHRAKHFDKLHLILSKLQNRLDTRSSMARPL